MIKGLITRKLEQDSFLRNWCDQNGVFLTEESFIRTEATQKKTVLKTDWVFFSSPKCVQHYFELYDLNAIERIGSLSTGTTKALKKLGYSPVFTGLANMNTWEIGVTFSALVKDSENVLFPIGNKSLKSIQQHFRKSQVEEIIVYTTTVLKKKIDQNYEFFIVSSPSNADGLLQSIKIEESGATFITFGTSTLNYMLQLGVGNKVVTAKSYTEEAIVKELEPLLVV